MGRQFSGIPGSGNSLKKQIINELHGAARIHFPRRHIVIKGRNDLYQMDIMDFQEYAKENKGFNYILALINCFSKKAFLEPLKNKTGVEVTNKLEKILNEIKSPFKLLQSDFGGEFWNKNTSELLKRKKIKLYKTYSKIKCAIVERFIRTYKGWLYKQFSINGNRNWLPIYKQILKFYNDRPNRVTGIAPSKVNARNEKQILEKYNNRVLPPKKKNKFKVGDTVRISRERGVFEKSYFFNWSPEIFTVYKVEATRPTVYKIKDFEGKQILGGWYEHELKIAQHGEVYLVEKILRKKPGYSYVKWMGFDNKYNEWVKDSNIV